VMTTSAKVRRDWKCSVCGATGHIMEYADGTVDRYEDSVIGVHNKSNPDCAVTKCGNKWQWEDTEGIAVLSVRTRTLRPIRNHSK
jgi:hypothetical protein